jgi:hypothetical protein
MFAIPLSKIIKLSNIKALLISIYFWVLKKKIILVMSKGKISGNIFLLQFPLFSEIFVNFSRLFFKKFPKKFHHILPESLVHWEIS